MNETTKLDRIQIAAPCQESWEQMTGNNRVRFCQQCELNVYNLSGMTRRQAAQLVEQSEGRLCVRFFQRADGTVLTEDCPVGLRALRRGAHKAMAVGYAVFGLILSAFISCGSKALPDADGDGPGGDGSRKGQLTELMGEAVAPTPMLGRIAAPDTCAPDELKTPDAPSTQPDERR